MSEGMSSDFSNVNNENFRESDNDIRMKYNNCKYKAKHIIDNAMHTKQNSTAVLQECMIQTKVERQPIQTLIDSGSTLCLIGPKFFSACPEMKEKLRLCQSKVPVIAVNGERFTMKGQIDFNVEIDGCLFPVFAYYSPMINYELILGFQFLNEHLMTFDFSRVKLNFPQVGVIRIKKDVTLKPRSETVMTGHLNKNMGRGDGLVSTHKVLRNMDLLVANSLVTIGKTIPIKILNRTNFRKKIRAGTRVALISRLGICDFIHETNSVNEDQLDDGEPPLETEDSSTDSSDCGEVDDCAGEYRETSSLNCRTDKQHVVSKQLQKSVSFSNFDYEDNLVNKSANADFQINNISMTPNIAESKSDSVTNTNVNSDSNDRKDFEKQFNLQNSEFIDSQKHKLMDLLWEFKDIFPQPGQNLRATNVLEFKIKLIDGAKEFKARPYRSNPKVRKEISKQVKAMLEADIIRPSCSPFASPVILVTKSDGTYRFVTDFRKLNSITQLDSMPLSSIQDSIESLGASNANYFSLLDMFSGYWQVPISEASKPLTAFVTHDGLFEYNRMAFGLANAPSVFSRLMQTVLQGLTWDICLIYLDDCIIFSRDFEDHIFRLRKVFERLRKASLTLKPSKCCFGRAKVRYLGYEVSKLGISPLKDKCKAVEDFPVPTKVKQVRSFLGLAGYYRRFVKNFSIIAAPLHNLTKKDVKFKWTSQCQNAFDELKHKLTNPPILAYPDYNKPYVLQTDASQEALGLVLSQVQGGVERVIAYGGKKLNPAEKNYSITELEALGVITGLKHFDPYLRGNKVKIVTDHSALKWLLTQKQPKGRIARWVCYLQSFNFQIVHRPGKALGNADSLSRRTYDDEDKNPVELVPDETIFPPVVTTANAGKRETNKVKLRGRRRLQNRPVFVLPTTDWSLADVRNQQLQDPKVKPYIHYLEKGDLPEDDNEARKLLLSKDAFILEKGILYHLLDSKTKDSNRQIDELRVCLVVPQTLKYDVLKSVHGDAGASHYGTVRTYTTLRLKYFWEGMYQECRNWVLSCEDCNTRKHPVRPTKAELQPLPTVRMNERWAMDLITLPLSSRGNRYLLTFTEYSTRFTEAFPIPNCQATTLARILVDEICFRYGSPRHILSDMGANFVSEVVAESCKVLGVERLLTTPYRPQTDGLLEKFNDTITKNLAMYVNENHNDWDKYVRAIVYSYNTSVCTNSTQYSPYFLMFGHEPLGPLETVLPIHESMKEEVKETILKLQKVREIAKKNLDERRQKMKEIYDKTSNPVSFKPGQLVWIYFPEIKVGGSKKFFHNYSGPYILLEETRPTNFRVAHAHNNQPLKNEVHVNRMKIYHHRNIMPPTEMPNMVTSSDNSKDDINPRDYDKITENVNVDSEREVQVVVPSLNELQTQPNPMHLADPSSDPATKVSTTPDPPVITTETLEKGENNDSLIENCDIMPIERLEPRIKRRETIKSPVELPEEYEIEKIVRGRYTKNGDIEYLIQWKGYGEKDRTFEPMENLNQAAKNYVKTHKIPITGKKNIKKISSTKQ